MGVFVVLVKSCRVGAGSPQEKFRYGDVGALRDLGADGRLH